MKVIPRPRSTNCNLFAVSAKGRAGLTAVFSPEEMLQALFEATILLLQFQDMLLGAVLPKGQLRDLLLKCLQSDWKTPFKARMSAAICIELQHLQRKRLAEIDEPSDTVMLNFTHACCRRSTGPEVSKTGRP